MPCVYITVKRDEYGLAGRYIPDQFIAEHVQCDAFRRHHVIRTRFRFPLAIHQWTYSVRITKGNHAVTGNHGHGGIGTATASVYTGNRGEHILDIHGYRGISLQFVGKHVQQDLRVGVGVDLAQVFLKQFLLQFVGIGEVAVVREADAVR